MPQSLAYAPDPCPSTPVAESRPDLATTVATYLADLREVVSACGYTFDALAAATGIDRTVLWRLLNGRRPWRLEQLLALPKDVRLAFEQKQLEREGYIVAKPAHAESGRRHLLVGLFWALSQERPGMAKAEIK